MRRLRGGQRARNGAAGAGDRGGAYCDDFELEASDFHQPSAPAEIPGRRNAWEQQGNHRFRKEKRKLSLRENGKSYNIEFNNPLKKGMKYGEKRETL